MEKKELEKYLDEIEDICCRCDRGDIRDSQAIGQVMKVIVTYQEEVIRELLDKAKETKKSNRGKKKKTLRKR